MARAQGSLEYLIIISVAIAVVAIVSMIIVNSFGQRQSDFVMASCTSAASTCRSTLIADPTASCDFCDTSCKFANGTEIFSTATQCCTQGIPSRIYDGSLGCMPSCKDALNTPYGACSDEQPKYCSDGAIVNSCGAPGNCECPSDTPICNSDGSCSSQCSGTGCITGSPPNYCNNGIIIKNACGGTYGCGCLGPRSRCHCTDGGYCCTDYHFACQADGTCKTVIDSTDCFGGCGTGEPCGHPPCPI